MRLRIAGLLLAALSILALSASNLSFAESLPFTGEITSNGINIRSDSTVGSKIICLANKGERVEVIAESYGWYKIRLPAYAPAYVRKDLFECADYKNIPTTTPLNLPEAKQCLKAEAVKDRINIRLRPEESSPLLGRISKGETLNIIKTIGDWHKVEPGQNSFGWINAKFVAKAVAVVKKDAPEAAKTIKEAGKSLIIEGIVKPYGKVFKRAAAHKLITKDNRVFLLKGDKKELDALNYRAVRIAGQILDLPKQKYPVIEVALMEAMD